MYAVIGVGLSSLPTNHPLGLKQLYVFIAGIFIRGTKSPNRVVTCFRSTGRFYSS